MCCSKHVEDHNVIYYYRIKELCIKLVIETILYYDARSEKLNISVANTEYADPLPVYQNVLMDW